MGSETGIEWTDSTWNPMRGCTRVSEGCRHCYAETMASRFVKPGQAFEGFANKGRWTGKVELIADQLSVPLRWKKPRRIFVNSMSDTFHEALSNEDIAAVFGVMAACPEHTFQVLTKRPERAVKWFEWLAADAKIRDCDPVEIAIEEMAQHLYEHQWDDVERRAKWAERWPLPNCWIGTSVEDQATADERIPHLLRIPARVRFLSCEPLLGPVDLENVTVPENEDQLHRPWPWMGSKFNALSMSDDTHFHQPPSRIHWVIAGGESGPNARPMHPDWARSLRDQCQAAGVAFHFKQHGEYRTIYERKDDPRWVNTPKTDLKTRRVLNVAGGYGFHGEQVVVVERCGKAAAGRLLDGREWNQFPDVGDVGIVSGNPPTVAA